MRKQNDERNQRFMAAYQLKMTDAETANYLGVTVPTYSSWRTYRKLPAFYTKGRRPANGGLTEADKRFLEIHKLGFNGSKSARLLGVSRQYFSKMRKRHGLKQNAEKTLRGPVKKDELNLKCGAPLETAILDPGQQDRMRLFLKIVSRSKPGNVSRVIKVFRECGDELVSS